MIAGDVERSGTMPGDEMEPAAPVSVMPGDEMEPAEHAVLIEVSVSKSPAPRVLGMMDTHRIEPDMAGRAVDAFTNITARLSARGVQVSSKPIAIPPSQDSGFSTEEGEQISYVVAARVTPEERSKLEQQRDVRIYTNAQVAPFPASDCQSSVAKGTLDDVAGHLGVKQLWEAGYLGQDIAIGMVDSGINNDMKMSAHVTKGSPSDWGKRSLWDEHGDMTSTDILGMAPEAELYDIRISTGSMISNAIAGFDWAIREFRATGKPQILSNSWGIYQKSWAPDYASDPDHPFTRKMIEAIEAGMIVLFAAGNCGADCPVDKCGADVGPRKSIWGANGHERVITVGAVNINEEPIGYSSQGPAALSTNKPDFCAVSHFKGFFAVDTGTSAACPIAAGVVALLKQAYPTLTHDQAKQALIATAKAIGPAGWNSDTGYGRIQAKAAFDYLANR